MSNDKDGPASHIEVPDAAVAFQKMESFVRRILAVPKREIDRRAARVKSKKRKAS